jgi:hypothetical protein
MFNKNPGPAMITCGEFYQPAGTAFEREPRTFHQGDGRRVERLDAGFNAMELQLSKDKTQHQLQGFRGVALPHMRRADEISDDGALHLVPDEVKQVHIPDNRLSARRPLNLPTNSRKNGWLIFIKSAYSWKSAGVGGRRKTLFPRSLFFRVDEVVRLTAWLV